MNVPARGDTRFTKVFLNFRLPVNRDVLAGQSGDIDAVPAPAESHLETSMAQTVPAQAIDDTRLSQQVHRSLFQHTGADASLDVLAGAAFDHHGMHTGTLQEPRQEKSRRPRADDRHLRFRASHRIPRSRMTARVGEPKEKRNGRGFTKLVLF
jgi:hypothetical protein